MAFNVLPSIMPRDVVEGRKAILELMQQSPLPGPDLLRSLGLFLLPMDLKRFLFFDSIYRQLSTVPGIICEFGCRWGQSLAVLQGLRAIHEPLDASRVIVGFDTFEGLRGVTPADGPSQAAAEGAYGVVAQYEDYLTKLLTLKEQQGGALGHLQR